jgi:hypothetical protein
MLVIARVVAQEEGKRYPVTLNQGEHQVIQERLAVLRVLVLRVNAHNLGLLVIIKEASHCQELNGVDHIRLSLEGLAHEVLVGQQVPQVLDFGP